MDRNRAAFKQRRDYLLRELKALALVYRLSPLGHFTSMLNYPRVAATVKRSVMICWNGIASQ